LQGPGQRDDNGGGGRCSLKVARTSSHGVNLKVRGEQQWSANGAQNMAGESAGGGGPRRKNYKKNWGNPKPKGGEGGV